MKKIQHPELDKIHAVSEDSQKLGEFLEWLKSNYELCQFIEHKHTGDCWEWADEKALTYKVWLCGMNEGENLVPTHPRINDILAKYFNIDENAAERERRAILDALRVNNV